MKMKNNDKNRQIVIGNLGEPVQTGRRRSGQKAVWGVVGEGDPEDRRVSYSGTSAGGGFIPRTCTKEWEGLDQRGVCIG